MQQKKLAAAFLSVLVMGIVVGFYFANPPGTPLNTSRRAEAAGGRVKSPTGTAPDRYAYYPGTEELGKDEIRIVACGTGMPSARRSQAATCFLVELGNGDADGADGDL